MKVLVIFFFGFLMQEIHCQENNMRYCELAGIEYTISESTDSSVLNLTILNNSNKVVFIPLGYYHSEKGLNDLGEIISARLYLGYSSFRKLSCVSSPKEILLISLAPEDSLDMDILDLDIEVLDSIQLDYCTDIITEKSNLKLSLDEYIEKATFYKVGLLD